MSFEKGKLGPETPRLFGNSVRVFLTDGQFSVSLMLDHDTKDREPLKREFGESEGDLALTLVPGTHTVVHVNFHEKCFESAEHNAKVDQLLGRQLYNICAGLYLNPTPVAEIGGTIKAQPEELAEPIHNWLSYWDEEERSTVDT